MVKGNKREELKDKNVKYVGFTDVKLRAINPTRSKVNELIGREDSEDDKEVLYKTTDSLGNDKIRISAWLYDEQLDKYFIHSFNITNKERTSVDGVKKQFINSSAVVAWSDTEENLPDWFTHFLDKEGNKLVAKKFRTAMIGEEDLSFLLRSWLGRIPCNDPDSEVYIDMERLFDEYYSELQALIDSGYDSAFVALLGVKTDDADPTKQYQQVYGRAFLPMGFLPYISKNKFPSAFASKTWSRFVTNATGDYGFKAFYELKPLMKYDPKADIATSPRAKADVTPSNSKY